MDPSSYRISEKTVAHVAGAAIRSVPGTRDVDAKLAGLAGRSFPRVDVHIDRPAGLVALDIEVVTAYPAPVGAITDEVRRTVVAHVETLTGLTVSRLNIAVADAEVTAGATVTRSDLADHPVGFVPTPVQVTATHVVSPVTQPAQELSPVTVDSSTYESVRHVDVPDAAPLTPVETPRPVRPISVAAPPPVVPRGVEVPGVERLRPVSVEKQKALRLITARRPKFVPVERPMPQALRRITVPPSPITSPHVPEPRPLDKIFIDPDRVDQDSYTETTASRKERR